MEPRNDEMPMLNLDRNDKVRFRRTLTILRFVQAEYPELSAHGAIAIFCLAIGATLRSSIPLDMREATARSIGEMLVDLCLEDNDDKEAT